MNAGELARATSAAGPLIQVPPSRLIHFCLSSPGGTRHYRTTGTTRTEGQPCPRRGTRMPAWTPAPPLGPCWGTTVGRHSHANGPGANILANRKNVCRGTGIKCRGMRVDTLHCRVVGFRSSRSSFMSQLTGHWNLGCMLSRRGVIWPATPIRDPLTEVLPNLLVTFSGYKSL